MSNWPDEWAKVVAERDGLKEMACNWQTAAVAEMERCIAAERERDGLRKALEQIYAGTTDEAPPFRSMDRQQMRAVARDALAALVTSSVPSEESRP